MTTTMPSVRQVPSPNYTPTLITHDLVVLHMMEGGYEGSVNWLCRRDVPASAHLCMRKDGLAVTQLVPLQYKAWAQCRFNSRGVSLEIEGFTAQGMSDTTMRAAALITAWLCRAYAIPPTWARGGQGRGVCCHHDLGVGGGGHVDICGVGDATWLAMMAAVKEAYDALGDGPLPVFALHGAPGPHQVETPTDAPFEPSHGGATRHDEPALPVVHPTTSGFPLHTVADLQWKLRRMGASIAVDGSFGAATRWAVERFQATHGCDIDGVPGPQTWAALDAALAA